MAGFITFLSLRRRKKRISNDGVSIVNINPKKTSKRYKGKGKGKEEYEEGKQHYTVIIPYEMIIEILTRVPVQDLSDNLKFVCKKWYSIINNGSFAYSHFERRNRKSFSFSQLEAVCVRPTTATGESVAFSSLEWHGINESNYKNQTLLVQNLRTEYLYMKKNMLGTRVNQIWFEPANPVNGFVCFSSNDGHCHVCNPMTMEYFTTPIFPYNWNPAKYARAGLGFCPLTHQYKVVVIIEEWQYEPQPDKRIEYCVLTVGIDRSWRPLKWIDDHSSIFPSDCRSAAYVNGALYWWCSDDPTILLLCFDVTKEDFDVIVVPIERDSEEEYVSTEDKGGRLCLMTKKECSNDNYVLFKGYVAHNIDDLGSLNSWRLEFSVTTLDIYGAMETVDRMSFTNEILMIEEDGNKLAFVDVATGNLLATFSCPHRAIVIPYVPSLVPLQYRPMRENFYLDSLCGL